MKKFFGFMSILAIFLAISCAKSNPSAPATTPAADTETPVVAATSTPTSTFTDTGTQTATASGTSTASVTDTGTAANTFTATESGTATATGTHTETFTDTGTNTETFTATMTFTVTDTGTNTPTFTNTATSTPVTSYSFSAALSRDSNWGIPKPRYVAWDAYSSNLLVCDSDQGYIYRAGADGTFISKFAISGPAKAIAVDSSGNIYACIGDTVVKMSSSGGVLLTFGSTGSGTGELSGPSGIAVDSAGNICVSDTGNNRIQKFDPSGAFATMPAIGGSGDGQLSSPRGLWIDSSDNIFVADSGNTRWQKLASDGTFLLKAGSAGSGTGQFSAIYDVKTDASGNVYTIDYSNCYVQKFTSAGAYDSRFLNSGTDYSLALDPSGNIYTTDTYKVEKFNSSFALQLSIGPDTSSDGRLFRPRFISISNSGSLYVADSGNNRAQKFSTAFAFQQKYTYGSYSDCAGVAADANDNVYITNNNGSALFRVDKNTSAVTDVSSGMLTMARGVEQDANGVIYVADRFLLRKFANQTGAYIAAYGSGLSYPIDTAVSQDMKAYVADYSGNMVEKLDALTGSALKIWGTSGAGNGQFSGPMGIAVDPAGYVYVVDNGNKRVQKFDSSGNYIAQFGSAGTGDMQFLDPVGIAVDSAFNVYVSDYQLSCVKKYSPQ